MSTRATRSIDYYEAEARAERRERRKRDEARFCPPVRERRGDESPDTDEGET